MKGTQGIYTDNMYIGDNAHYIAFYTDKNDNNKKKLRITGADIVFSYNDEQGGTSEKTLDERIEEIEAGTGESTIKVEIVSDTGNIFTNPNQTARLTCYVYQGTTDITDQVTSYSWQMVDQNGDPIDSWRPIAGRVVDVSAAQIMSKGVITCTVNF